jgi:peptide-methionine (S)-S-oxide reductase
MEKVAFGGGCFWCTEAVFKMLKGVSKVLPGYAGGTAEDATYEKVSTGRTGHVEVVYLEYDPTQVKFRDLLTVFFASHDPTSLNKQGNDVGPQYRSAIFYSTEAQRKESEELIKEVSGVTELIPLKDFYEAENYHKDYLATHPDQAYCRVIINPKLEKIQKEFGNLLNQYE